MRARPFSIASRYTYTSDEELDSIIYDEIMAEAEHTADMRHCFIEVDIFSVDDPERSW